MEEPNHAEEASKEINVEFEEAPVQDEAPQTVDEAAPVEAPPEETSQQDLMDTIAAMQAKIDANEQQLRDSADMPEQRSVQDMISAEVAPEPVASDTPDFGDPYDTETYNKNMQAYLAQRDEQVKEDVINQVLGSDRLQALEMNVWTREHERNVERASSTFGDRFNYDEKGQDYIAAQQKLPGLSVDDAHRVLDYDRLLQEHNQLAEGQKERANVQQPNSTGASRLVAKTDDGTKTVKLTAGEKNAGLKYFSMMHPNLSEKEIIQKYAAAKLRQREGGYI